MGGRTDFSRSWTSSANCFHEMIRYSGDRTISLVDVMGYTGAAFRINIHPVTVDVGGPFGSFVWGPHYSDAMANLGFRMKYIGEPNHEPPGPELLETAVEVIQSSIDQGIPAMAWDLFVPEFGIIYGYDDDTQTLKCRDSRKDADLPYVNLGRGQTTELFVMTIEEPFKVSEKDRLIGALQIIVEHATIQLTPEGEPPGRRNGLEGYKAWIHAFQEGQIEVFGNGYNAVVVTDAREFATEFLRRLPDKWGGDSVIEQDIRRLAAEAAVCYAAAAEELGHLSRLFPFPNGGVPNEPEPAAMAIAALERAKRAEERGVELLGELLEVLVG